MTTMQKFKAYFGMVPPSEYEDDYLTDPADRAPAPMGDAYAPAPARHGEAMSARERLYMERYRGAGAHDEYYDEPYEADYAEVDYARRGDDRVYAARAVHVEADLGPAPMRGRLEPLSRSANVTARGGVMAVRGANALAPEVRPEVVAETASRITTLRPADYSEARTIGERFRSGSPVIMDLVEMNNDDAKRMVDFAAGLVFALRGSFDKVATKVFLLSPAGVEVTPEDRRRLAETGFHSQS
ncbi:MULTISPECIES: cell division protein SepF [unclassified Gordonia (in: high G+C Gram-positive bacteria)]|uniref:cell division protein SepF n=1 Tax=unclassified Gordonia (in: high G+C Gram-positive bacteria) TaxID=2657482 RepID=UPI001FFFB2FB|nr:MULTISPECIES: cell division protein SepF [unclassified Gordonia (in: high G+C Gram-positive bacteria)]UQE73577.1 cell division protein SepF [Gordonia sp. PP30]